MNVTVIGRWNRSRPEVETLRRRVGQNRKENVDTIAGVEAGTWLHCPKGP